MENGALLYQLITIIVLLLPVAGLIWKAAKQSGRTEINEKQISKILEEMEEIKRKNIKIDEHDKRIEKLEVNYQQDVAEIKTSINQLNLEFTKSLTELCTSVNFIKESLKEKD